MKKALLVFGLLLAGVLTFLWMRVLLGASYQAHHPAEFTQEGFMVTTPGKLSWFRHNYSVELPQHGRFHLLLASDTQGFVFDIFLAHIPPEKAPGAPGSNATQQWEKPYLPASFRRLGFERGKVSRIGQNLNGPLYFYGTDYYVAVPPLLLIFISLLPALWSLARSLKHRNQSRPNSRPIPRRSRPPLLLKIFR
jgi:hypothetical protein